jgi:hypothetical protein
MIISKKIILRRILPILIGGILGYGYYYFIGCNNGCSIQSSPLASTIYGAAIGRVLSFPSRNNKNKSEN